MLVSCPLSELLKDSDGDGLTDLLEEVLLLDPHNPDTDGDGIPDGIDPMPQVSDKGTTSPLSVVATHVAFQGAPEEDTTVHPPDSTGNKSEPLFITGYVVADRTEMGHAVDPSRRVVVLTRREAELAARKFGFIYADEIDGFQTNWDGSQAYFTWMDSRRSLDGASIFKRDGQGWHSHTYASWSSQRPVSSQTRSAEPSE